MVNETRIPIAPKSSHLKRQMMLPVDFLPQYQRFWERDPSLGESPLWDELATRVINRPYLDGIWPISHSIYDLKHAGRTVYHRNHDVSHAMRQRLYVQQFLNLVATQGNPTYQPIAKEIMADRQLSSCLELAIFMCRAGRTNEQSGKEDPSNAKRSANLFAAIAERLGYEPRLIQFVNFCVANHKPTFSDELIAIIGSREKAQLIKNILNASHHLDLVRCKSGFEHETIKDAICHDLELFVDTGSLDLDFTVQGMMHSAATACALTGTRVKHHGFTHYSPRNDAELKLQCVDGTSAKFTELKTGCVFPSVQHPPTTTVTTAIDALITQARDHAATAPKPYAGRFAGLYHAIFPGERRAANRINAQVNELIYQLEMVKRGFDPITLKTISADTRPEGYSAILQEVIAHAKTRGERAESGYATLLENQQQTLLERLPNSALEKMDPQSTEYKRLSSMLDLNMRSHERPIRRFEVSQMYKASSKIGWFIDRVLHKPEQSQAGGDTEEMEIVAIYKIKKDATPTAAAQAAPVAPAPSAMSMRNLLHGCSLSVAMNVVKNGFDAKYCNSNKFTGYGPLGKGVYMTPEATKASLFATCSSCGASRCGCVDAQGERRTKTLVLADGQFASAEPVIGKAWAMQFDDKSTGAPAALVGIAKNTYDASAFRTTEVCVTDGKDLQPTYVVQLRVKPKTSAVPKAEPEAKTPLPTPQQQATASPKPTPQPSCRITTQQKTDLPMACMAMQQTTHPLYESIGKHLQTSDTGKTYHLQIEKTRLEVKPNRIDLLPQTASPALDKQAIIAAITIIGQNNPHARLVIAGPHKAAIEKIANEHITQQQLKLSISQPPAPATPAQLSAKHGLFPNNPIAPINHTSPACQTPRPLRTK